MFKWKIGDTVKVEKKSVYKALSPSEMNERLAYALVGQMHPDDCPQYEYITLATQEMVDQYNSIDTTSQSD